MSEFADLLDTLEEDPLTIQGIDPLGHDCYKIRLSISSNTGKNDGARVIYYVYVIEEQVVLLSIFDKAEATLKPKELLDLLKFLRRD